MIRQTRWIVLCIICVCLTVDTYAQKIKILDGLEEPVEEVEAYVHKGAKELQFFSDANGIVDVSVVDYDSIVFQHQSYKTLTMTYAELKEQRFHVLLEFGPYRYEPFVFRHNQDFEFQKDQPTKVVKLKPKETSFYDPPNHG